MRFGVIFILIQVCLSTSYGQDYSKKELNYKPQNLEEAVEQLKKIHPDTTKQKIRSMTEDEFLAGSHFGLGMWIRNNWQLWKGKGLADYFNSIGIFHPDDMSGIILRSYYRELTGKEWDVDNQVKYYQDYWKKSNEHFRKLETDTAYQKKVKRQYDSLERAQLQKKQLEWAKGKRVSGYLEYQCGLLPLGERTKVEGTILEWRDNILFIHIDTYVDENKKNRVIKCNKITNDNVLIKYHDLFRLVE